MDLPIAKVTCHSWLQMAVEDAFLGPLGLRLSVLLLNKLAEQVREPTKEWVEPNGKDNKIPRLSGGFQVFHKLYGHSKGICNV